LACSDLAVRRTVVDLDNR
jgi:hypothetical protein